MDYACLFHFFCKKMKTLQLKMLGDSTICRNMSEVVAGWHKKVVFCKMIWIRNRTVNIKKEYERLISWWKLMKLDCRSCKNKLLI